ncbi:TonB-dependent receptor plug domain-containing protein [Chitinimonas sp. BJB300]|uniref:TonB-dependent receptor plug domain-containing protein n=1 Tax=Chitinimonas sp. BJB300 TaxID=1559339 RepID=UPI001303F52B|nr:TonB-dependent receptor [Chitinimonas sp. BJB300]
MPLPLALSGLMALPAWAEEATPVDVPTVEDKAVQRTEQISITGRQLSDTLQRQQSSASRIIIGKEEINRYGDTSVADVLKRLPGVTLGGKAGRGGEIKMRGMGNGMTQILVNGEPMARGFSIDSLSPDQIERIEVLRSPVAEFSAQAIAGTINIVLNEDAKKRQNEARFVLGSEDGRLQSSLSLSHSDKQENFNYTLAGNLSRSNRADDDREWVQRFDPVGNLISQDRTQGSGNSQGYNLHLTPRFTWKLDEKSSLTLQPFLMHSRSQSSSSANIDRSQPDSSKYSSYVSDADNGFDMIRTNVNWQRRMEEGRKLNVRAGFNVNQRTSDSVRQEFKTDGSPLQIRWDNSKTRDNGFTSGGKWSTPFGDEHALAIGWDLETSQRRENRQIDNVWLDPTQPPVLDTTDYGDLVEAGTQRYAVFAQDEWEISPQWSAYAGLRWEGITTKSEDQLTHVSHRSGVWSPTLHGVWRIPDSKNDQIRASLTRSYRAPRTGDLIARPYGSLDNSEIQPDRVGNPDLKPELAWGLELAYEHYLSQTGLLSANIFTRQITDLVRRDMRQEMVGNELRWVSRPKNIGNATAQGVELEAKFRLAELMETKVPMDIRANYSRYWSSVEGVPGPNNRLESQAKESVNLGMDYRLSSAPLTLGGNLHWVPGYRTQISDNQYSKTASRRVYDMYALWRFNSSAQLRIAAANLGQFNDVSESGQVYTAGSTLSRGISPSYINWNASLELKF